MTKRRWIVLGGVVLAGVVALGIGHGRDRRTAARDPGPSATVASTAVFATPTPTAVVPASPADPPPTATPAPSASPPAAPARTVKPRATGDPRLAYAAFLLRVNDDRVTVDGLNAALTTAANAQDPDAVRRASVDILDFVDVERDWLQGHPPADCYAAAHDSAGAMLAAYGAAADRAIDWSATGGGIAGLGALGRAVEAGQAAADALTAFGHTLEATRCPG